MAEFTLMVFGKKDCPKCKVVKVAIEQYDLPDSVEYEYEDMDEVHGLSVGTWFDVMSVPTTILVNEAEEVLGRWIGEAPELREIVELVE